ncbi:hypothetical protein GGS20DRAFT_573449 [Poronia punctata]|nr:hypothetical protein GGS20DRAFT_573449 [Poronia punctata]
MLERTAARLEPCSLRVLPAHSKPLRSPRQLYTSFWQHGAADVELSRAWQALMHGTIDRIFLLRGTRSSSLNASALLLDFLYPVKALTLMRRLPFRPRPSHVTPRLYNSSITGQELEPRSPTSRDPSQQFTEVEESSEQPTPSVVPPDERPVAIERNLRTAKPEDADELWRQYKSLDEQSQATYLRPILVFLSKTNSVSDAWKISELLRRLDKSTWESSFFVTGVAAEVNLQNDTQALSLFEEGLRSATVDSASLVSALDILLAYAMRLRSSEFLGRLWALYPEMALRWDFDMVTADFKELALVSDLAEKAIQFPQYVARRLKESSTQTDRVALNVLQKILVRRALLSCDDSLVASLLLITKDSHAFEDYIRFARQEGKKSILIATYIMYRELPGSKPSKPVLFAAFEAVVGETAPVSRILAGVELIWEDWYRFQGAPSRRAYQRYLAFHAARGDKDRVYSIWIEYVERFSGYENLDLLRADDTFAHLLHVHAVNGEAEEAQRIFDDIVNKFRLDPDTYHWNILLNAYVRAGDYDGALDVFSSLCGATTPDVYSYATLMRMVGSRGDLGFAIDLYRRAQASGIQPNQAIVSSLIDAYCQNGNYKEAEEVCIRAAQKGINSSDLWNRLLYYHAVRRDLASMNRIMNVMADKRVPYDHLTYQQLLLGLALCRQSQHALNLLTIALKEGLFKVTPAHFNIVMGALLRNGEPALVTRLCWLMKEHSIHISEDVLFRFSQALTRWGDLPPQVKGESAKKKWLGEAMRIFLSIYGLEGSQKASRGAPQSRPNGRDIGPAELLRSGPEVYQFSYMMHLFARLNDADSIDELIGTYRHIFQGNGSGDSGWLPIGMLNAVMLHGLQSGHYDRVKSTWDLLFAGAKRAGRSADHDENNKRPSPGQRISPKYHYALSQGLRVMQEVLFKEGDPSHIVELVEQVLEAGFQVDSKNWNYYVQILVQLKQYKPAFAVCEDILMPNWTGWKTVRVKEPVESYIPPNIRRKGSSPRHLRPTATTLYWLARGYLELEKSSPWSGAAAKTLGDVQENCRRAVRAVKSMRRVYSHLENEILNSTLIIGREVIDQNETTTSSRAEDGENILASL